MSYLAEFAGLMAVFSVMIVAPGADTAMVMRQSLLHGRRAGVATALGVASSLMAHVFYTAIGLGVIISQSLLAFAILKYLGAAYLFYVGVAAIRAGGSGFEPDVQAAPQIAPGLWRAYGVGFLTNALNPKPILFFLSMFAALVSPTTPFWIVMLYGLGMACALALWFSLLANVLTVPIVRKKLRAVASSVNRIAGALFVALGLRLAFASQK